MKYEEYEVIYKCRMCGKNHSEGHIRDSLAHILIYTHNILDDGIATTVGGSHIIKTTIVGCENGGIAIGDFVGFSKVKKKEE